MGWGLSKTMHSLRCILSQSMHSENRCTTHLFSLQANSDSGTSLLCSSNKSRDPLPRIARLTLQHFLSLFRPKTFPTLYSLLRDLIDCRLHLSATSVRRRLNTASQCHAKCALPKLMSHTDSSKNTTSNGLETL